MHSVVYSLPCLVPWILYVDECESLRVNWESQVQCEHVLPLNPTDDKRIPLANLFFHRFSRFDAVTSPPRNGSALTGSRAYLKQAKSRYDFQAVGLGPHEN